MMQKSPQGGGNVTRERIEVCEGAFGSVGVLKGWSNTMERTLKYMYMSVGGGNMQLGGPQSY